MRVELLEHQTLGAVALTAEQARSIRSVRYSPDGSSTTPIVDVRIGQKEGYYELRSRGICGKVSIGDVDLNVRSRMSAQLLEQMLSRLAGVRITPSGRLSEGADLELRVDSNFLDQVDQLVRAGLAAAYRVRSDIGSAPKGAIDFGWFSNPLAIEMKYSYPEFSRDIPENQQLVGALNKIGAASRSTGRPASRARQLRTAFEEIEPDATPRALHDTTAFPSYRPALALADWILRATRISASAVDATFTSQGTLYEPSRLFEAYVRSRAERIATALGGAVDNQSAARPVFLDTAQRWRVYPDVVVWRGTSCLVVMDAKYKPTSTSPGRADLYQALAYAHSFHTKSAVLVYASEQTRSRRFQLGTMNGVDVTVIEVDVSHEIDTLDADLDEALTSSLSRPPIEV